METRIVHTQYWMKQVKRRAPKEARFLFIYLLTCSRINLCGIFELDDSYILLETALAPKELETAKEYLESTGKVYFYKGWVLIANSEEHNHYNNSPKTSVAYQRQLSEVPEDVMDFFDTVLSGTDTSMDSTMHSTGIVPINKKEEIITKKLGVVKGTAYLVDLPDLETLTSTFPLTEKRIRAEAAKASDYIKSKGKVYKDCSAFFRNWLRRVVETEGIKPRTEEPKEATEDDITDEQRAENLKRFREMRDKTLGVTREMA